MSKLVVLNRIKAEEYTKESDGVKKAIISICSYGGTTPIFERANDDIIDVVYLHFDDVESGENTMTEFDAMHVARFVEKHKDTADVFVVQCEEGSARSAGVAAAILKYLKRDDRSIFDSPKYNPNIYCYNKTLAALKNLEYLHRFQANYIRQLFILKAYDVVLEAFERAKKSSYPISEMYYKEFINHAVIFFQKQGNDDKAQQIKQLGEGMKGWHHSRYQADVSIGVAANELYRLTEKCKSEDVPYYKNACAHIGYLYADAFCEIGGFSSAKKIIETTYKLAEENKENSVDAFKANCCFLMHEVERISEFIT